MFTEKLRIKNLRCFEKASFTFNRPPTQNLPNQPEIRLPNVNLLLGSNGTGKTTTCQALTIAILKPLLATSGSGFRTDRIIRFEEESASVSATFFLDVLESVPLEDTNNRRIWGDENAVATRYQSSTGTIKRRGDAEFIDPRGANAEWSEYLFDDEHPGFFIVAYGANRRTERPEAYNERLRSVKYQRIASLFEPHVGLVPISIAYTQCHDRGRWQEVIDIINTLLVPPIRMTEKVEFGNEPRFDYDGISLTANLLSDGYRMFLAWLIDFLAHLSRVLPMHISLRNASGIVIVDEVDLFLAPAWQRTVVESLSKTFPNIQWFCSTHSALVAGSLDKENIYILENMAPHTSGLRRPSSEFEGKSVEKVLSYLFDVHQPRSPELQRQLRDLARQAMEGDNDASIEYLRRLSAGTVRE